MLATVDNDEITLKPDREHPVHKGFCCHKGLSFGAVNSDRDRLNVPLHRTNKGEYPAEFEEVSWDETFAGIGERLSENIATHGPEAVATRLTPDTSYHRSDHPVQNFRGWGHLESQTFPNWSDRLDLDSNP
ncbi:MAG: hypothetical protein OXI59_23440, partial [Gemmatimonadota bacterium]|nr:hypothetical protein [Gemmatimonadota bacterium]